ncbi:MAG: hypothetical protein AMJ53_10500 [Gammaproteobacteria bacterium SG8_11]|nr:MAG: hypothetical protein AMJ53_10500 [Gammaproteobacteria bacterium SG8_11]
MSKLDATQQRFMDPNLSFTDRQIRFVIGAIMIGSVLFVASAPMGMWSLVALASIPFIASAIIGWDPLYAIAGKSTYMQGEEDIQQRCWTCANIGTIDRAVRFGIGLMLIASLLTMNAMQVGMAITLLSIPLIVTAITAWDPIYAALGINSFSSRGDVQAAESDASEKTLVACYIFPQRRFGSASCSQAA